MMNQKPKTMFRLRSILLTVNLALLLLPITGLFFFRFYENALVQQTESELISQAAVISSIYKNYVKAALGDNSNYGRRIDVKYINKIDAYYTPIKPQIDLSNAVLLPPRPDGRDGKKADTLCSIIGTALYPILEDAKRTTLSGVRILDYNGVVVSGRDDVGLDFSFLPEIKGALSGVYISVIRERISDSPSPALASISRGTGIRLFVAFPIIEDEHVLGVIYLSRTPQNIMKYLYAEKEKVILAGVVFVLLTFMITLLTSYMIARPIHRLIQRTKDFSRGDETIIQKDDVSSVQEIEWLSQSFAQMAKSLNDRSEYIREFAMHVSHEFKTPMTSIQGSAELLLEHIDDMEEKKKRKFLSNIIADSDRLRRLVNRLLDLAKADNVQVSQESTSLNNVLKALEKRYKDLGLNVSVSLKKEFIVSMGKEHLETIFSNLFDNAIQHGADNIHITSEADGNHITLVLADDGKGISTANKAKIFTPFFTTKRDVGGTGLGLGIIHSLLRAHDGEIRVLESEKGAQFEIKLQISPN